MKIKNNFPIVIMSCAWIISFNSAAECRDDIPPSTPNSRFTQHDNGTITDTFTGLMWMRCSLGQIWTGTNCTGSASVHNWKSALNNAENNNFAEQEDWYLPNIKELSSIIEYACVEPAINTTLFPDSPPASYWTSTPVDSWLPLPGGEGYAWRIKFSHGANLQNEKSEELHVRLVRAVDINN